MTVSRVPHEGGGQLVAVCSSGFTVAIGCPVHAMFAQASTHGIALITCGRSLPREVDSIMKLGCETQH